MTVALSFVGGDEIIEPFLLENSDGEIFDLTGMTVSGGIWWRERERMPLTVGAGLGIEITSLLPPDVQTPHGFIRLTEAQTALIPQGQVASIRVVAVSGDAVTMSSYFYPLERIV